MIYTRLSIRPREGPGIEPRFPEHRVTCQQGISFTSIATTLEERKGTEIWNEIM